MPSRRLSATSRTSVISQRVDCVLAECRRRGAPPTVEEVEALYTDGCAEILMLEAEHRRVSRGVVAAHAGAREDASCAAENEALSQRAERVATELAEVRSDLRQLRAALEWAQSGAYIEQSVGFEPAASYNSAQPH